MNFSQRFDIQSLRSSEDFTNLDRSLQHIIQCLSNSQTSLAALVERESEQISQQLTVQVDRLEKLHTDNRSYEVTQSLHYPGIFLRQAHIDNAFNGIENSYDWIFDEPQISVLSDHAQLWSNFPHWLRSEHGLYWINGKAGSGKSTLMNYICDDNRRLEFLREWCPNSRLLTITFFFWNTGTRQQKSIEGLLRSLLYQIITECGELIRFLPVCCG